jgi:hypothetical protein
MVDQFGVEEACKVAAKSFVATDEFVAETEVRNESTYLKPEYGTERAQEEDDFGSGESNHLFGKTGVCGVAPFESPVGFALNAWNCFDGVEQVQFSLLDP